MVLIVQNGFSRKISVEALKFFKFLVQHDWDYKISNLIIDSHVWVLKLNLKLIESGLFFLII